jgi:hypothetical protein
VRPPLRGLLVSFSATSPRCHHISSSVPTLCRRVRPDYLFHHPSFRYTFFSFFITSRASYLRHLSIHFDESLQRSIDLCVDLFDIRFLRHIHMSCLDTRPCSPAVIYIHSLDFRVRSSAVHYYLSFIRCIEHHHHSPSTYHSFPLDIHYKHRIPDISPLAHNHLATYLFLSCRHYLYLYPVLLSCSRILFPPLCCRLMIHFFQMREALVVIGSVRGCILLVGYLRQKRNIKKRRSKRHVLGFTITRKFLWILLSIYEDCKARTKRI